MLIRLGRPAAGARGGHSYGGYSYELMHVQHTNPKDRRLLLLFFVFRRHANRGGEPFYIQITREPNAHMSTRFLQKELRNIATIRMDQPPLCDMVDREADFSLPEILHRLRQSIQSV